MRVYGVFPLSDSDSYPIPTLIPMKWTKDPLEQIPMQKLQWKLVKFHLIGTNRGVK